GAIGTLASSARSALLTTTLPRELLAEANGIFQSVREGLRLIAPLIGAAIYAAVGAGVVAVIDSATFVAVVAAIALMRTPEPRILRRVGDVRIVGIGMTLFALGDLSFVSSKLLLVAVGIAVAGAGISWVIVGIGSALQLRTPLRLQGRVASAAELVISTPQTLSIALGAALVAIVDYRLLVVAEAAAV